MALFDNISEGNLDKIRNPIVTQNKIFIVKHLFFYLFHKFCLKFKLNLKCLFIKFIRITIIILKFDDFFLQICVIAFIP